MLVICLVASDYLNFGHGRRPCNKVHTHLTRTGLVSREKVPDVKRLDMIIDLPLHPIAGLYVLLLDAQSDLG